MHYAIIEVKGVNKMYKKTFTERLKQIRHEVGYSQVDVCKELEILPSKLAKIELGTQNADVETIGKLAEFYDVSIDWLFGLARRKKENNKEN